MSEYTESMGYTLIPYGLKNGQLVHIDDVERGDKCGCTCPNCNGLLRANKGEKKMHYFSHQNKENCVGAYESAVHLLAKEVFRKHKTLSLPEFELNIEYIKDEKVRNLMQINNTKSILNIPQQNDIKYKDVLTEKFIENTNIKPDATAIDENGSVLYVEFFKTHAVDEDKKLKLLDLNVNCVEVNLNYFHFSQTKEEDESNMLECLNDTECHKWISHYYSKESIIKELENKQKERKKKDEDWKIKEMLRLQKEKTIEKEKEKENRRRKRLQKLKGNYAPQKNRDKNYDEINSMRKQIMECYKNNDKQQVLNCLIKISEYSKQHPCFQFLALGENINGRDISIISIYNEYKLELEQYPDVINEFENWKKLI